MSVYEGWVFPPAGQGKRIKCLFYICSTVNFTLHPAKIQLRTIHIASEHLTPKLVQSSLATKHKNTFLLFFIL
jgi:hypothetical protein